MQVASNRLVPLIVFTASGRGLRKGRYSESGNVEVVVWTISLIEVPAFRSIETITPSYFPVWKMNSTTSS